MIQRLATIVNYYLRYQIIGLETQQRVISFYWLRSFEFDFNFNYLHISESNNKALSALFRIASPLYLIHIGVWWMHGWKDTYINKYNVEYAKGTIIGGKEPRKLSLWLTSTAKRDLTNVDFLWRIKAVVLKVWLANYLCQNHLEHILKWRFPALQQVGVWDLGVYILKCSR